MNDQSLIIADKPTLPVFAIAPQAIELRDNALSVAALIGKVENAAQNKAATQAHIELKRIALDFEKARKKLKEPLLEAGRQLDRVIATELLEVNKEIGRIQNICSEFELAERRRVQEEQELQRRELARIEAEKQAEIARIAREQAEAERKAREAAEAAAKLAAEATNKKQREAAELARLEAEQQARVAAEAAAKSAAEMNRVQEAAAAATLAEAKPITATRANGQVVKDDWEINIVNPYELAKFHPDCVKIEPLLTPIKAALNAGITVKGVTAKKVVSMNVRTGNTRAIEV